MLKFFSKTIQSHKRVTALLIVVLIIIWYFGYQSLSAKDKNSTQYVTAAAEKGPLIVSVSGSGQVAVSDQMDIKPEISGKVTYVGVKDGQEVKAGTLLAQIDNREALKAVREAETALETSRLELDKLLAPADELDLLKAESAVATAKRNLEELIDPDEFTLSQAENSLTAAKDVLTKLKFSQESSYQKALDAEQKAEDNLEEVYEDAFNTIANTFLDLPAIITGIRDVLYSEEISDSEIIVSNNWNKSTLINTTSDYNDRYELEKFVNKAENDYQAARKKYDENFKNYKNASRYSDKDLIETLLEETLETVRATAETVKSEVNMLDWWVDCRARHNLPIYKQVTEYQSDLKSYTSKTNSFLSGLLSNQRSFDDYKEAILDAKQDILELKQNQPLDLAAAERSVKEKAEALAKLKNPKQYEIDTAQITIREKELALEELKAGADELDIRAKKIALEQKEEARRAAQQNLADYYVHAPFDGVIVQLKVKKGDLVAGSTALASIITQQKIAEITLNEIEAVLVKPGQKVTLQFDAAEDLTITGAVAKVDTLGTVTQGVVSYGVKIAFDIQDERIKPGMSVSASIITEFKQNVLLAPFSAVKTMGTNSYVEVLVNGQPQSQTVVTGSSNDMMIEVVSGLKEGDQVVTQTISSGTSSTQTQSSGRSEGSPRGMMMMMR